MALLFTHTHTFIFRIAELLKMADPTTSKLSYYKRMKLKKELDYLLANCCDPGGSSSELESHEMEEISPVQVPETQETAADHPDDVGRSADDVGGSADANAHGTGRDHDKEAFLDVLRDYAVLYNVPLVQLTYLLKVLSPFMPFALPKRGRTVMKLPVKTPSPIIVAPGQYIHIGVENALKYVPVSVTGLEKIVLDINLDGVCMAESPPVTSWPIMLSIVGSNVRPFPCGVYIGPGQPGNANEYLRMFVEEMLQIRGRKVLVSSSQKEMSVEIRLFCCDTKARTFITGT